MCAIVESIYMAIEWLKSWVVNDAPSRGYGDGNNIAFIDGQNVYLGTMEE